MTRVSQLTIIFRDKLQNLHKNSVENSDVVDEKKPSNSSSSNESDELTRFLDSWSSSSFQLPLHYPKYTKEEYEIMSEEELNRLLKLYGLPIDDIHDLCSKREFAMGAFLWEKELDSSLDVHDSVNPKNSSIGDCDESSIGLVAVLRNMVPFIFRV